MKRGLKWFFVILVIIIAIAAIVVPICYIWCSGHAGCDSKSSLMYYTFAVISGNGTFWAVIVALFSQQILDWLFACRCDISLRDDNFIGYVEDAAIVMYENYLLLSNPSSSVIRDCEIVIKKIMYKQNPANNLKKISKIETNLIWPNGRKKCNIRKGDSLEIPLARILPNTPMGVPNHQNNIEQTHLVIEGASIPRQYNKQGTWEIEYEILSRQEIISKFKIIINWSGEWCDVEREMQLRVTMSLTKL